MGAIDEAAGDASTASGRRRSTVVMTVLIVLAIAGLYICYLRLARAVGTDADGAGNTLQAWDMLHGNVLLRGWTVSDVSFYAVELVEFAVIELVTGLHSDALTAGNAMTYTLVVVLVALLAHGRNRGRGGWARQAIALSFVLVPAPGHGQSILLNQPDHIGTAIPLLLTWLVIEFGTHDRAGAPRVPGRRLAIAVAAILAVGQVSDPLLTLIGAFPLALVGALRLVADRRWRPSRWRGLDAALVLAAAGSAVLAGLLSWLVRHAGGFAVHPVPMALSGRAMGRRIVDLASSIGVLFGCYFPDLHSWLERTLGVLHLVGVVAAGVALLVVGARLVAGRGERLEQLLAAGIVLNLAAFAGSALNAGVPASREIAAVLPLSAVLVARAFARHPARPVAGLRWGLPRVGAAVAALAVAGLLVAALISQVRVPATTPTGQAVADWLAGHRLTYGLGGYWTASTVTVDSGGALHVVPVISHGSQIQAYAWESRSDWYDATRHDARFIVIDLHNTNFGTVAEAVTQFGEPIQQVTLPTSVGRSATVLVYDRNLLAGLPAWCLDARPAPSMAQCHE